MFETYTIYSQFWNDQIMSVKGFNFPISFKFVGKRWEKRTIEFYAALSHTTLERDCKGLMRPMAR